MKATVNHAVGHLLGLQASFLQGLSDEEYIRRGCDGGSCIGGHVRHILDHARALLSGVKSHQVDYDQRDRGTAVESSREAGMTATADLARLAVESASVDPGTPLTVRVLVSPGAEPVCVESSFGRELTFVLSHTVHHHAIMAMHAKATGIQVPEGLGLAPATRAWLREQTCAH